MTVRRIVTGVNADGRARIVSDTQVEPKLAPSLPNVGLHYIWGADHKETVPTDGSESPWTGHFPPTDGYRVIISHVSPGLAGRDAPLTAQEQAESAAKFPGLHDSFDESDAGMHVSVTVDVGVILSGLIDLELDDGHVVHLKTGDVVIQNGTRHKWSNAGDSQATIAFILLGAHGPASASSGA